MGILTKSIPLKKRFFRKGKIFEIRPEASGTGRNGAESILNTSTETFDTFPNYAPFIDFGKNITDQKERGYSRTAR